MIKKRKVRNRTRRTLKRKTQYSKKFSIIGTNANGLKSKLDSLNYVITELKPAVIFIQETKVNIKGEVDLPGYEVHELPRTNSDGGSLLTAIDSKLDSVIVSEESEASFEILVVQAKVGDFNVRFINAYGPQEYAKNEDKIAFYSKLDQEVKNAKLFNCLICMELDANAKVGKLKIKDDPNETSENGEYLIDFAENNNLVICNTTVRCEGTITRERVTINGTERSVIDYIIVCEEMYSFLVSMKVDESRSFALSNFNKKNGLTNITKSDHNVLEANFNLSWEKSKYLKENRKAIFNFKDESGIKKFKELTSGNSLSSCFKNGDIIKESHQWSKAFKNILHRSFPKIRVTEPRLVHDDVFLQMRGKGIVLKSIEKLEKCLQVSGPKASESIVEKILELKTRITTFDRFISNSISEKNAKKIKDHFTNLTEEGHFSASKMWAIKKKLNLNKKDAGTPSAKFDAAGNLITTREGLLQLYRQTYIDRLAPKLPQDDYLTLQLAKEKLFNLRYLVSSAKPSADWSQEQIMKMCKYLKNRKARD